MAPALLPYLASGKRTVLWKVFLDNPGREYTQKELRLITRVSRATAVAVLRLLVKDGILALQKKGNVNLYILADVAINRQLKICMAVWSLRQLSDIKDIFLYGSAARGEYGPESDFDVLIVGKVERNGVISRTESLSRRLGRRITPVIFSPSDWAAMRTKDPAFYERVEKDRIRL